MKLVDEDVSRRSIAVTVKATKLSARALAYVLAAVGRKIIKEYRKAQTPQGKQSVKRLMGHTGDKHSIELSGDTRLFDRVARKWKVDYAFYQTGPDKYMLFFKEKQADAISGCFDEYTRRVLSQSKPRRIPVRDQLKRATEQLSREQPRQKERVKEAVHEDR